jgi:glutamyl-tRNA synthetase
MEKVIDEYRGRYAPSPSGYLHVGHAQTFYIAQKRAEEFGGKILLRLEDIDLQRCKKEYYEGILEDLNWFGLCYDVSCVIRQSERIDFYLCSWKLLYEKGFIYPSPHSRKDVERALSAPHEGDSEIIFPETLRQHVSCIPTGLTEPGCVNWRFRVPNKEISFQDLNCGTQSFICGKDFGDFVVWRADGLPAYELGFIVYINMYILYISYLLLLIFLAVVVDDADMGITEVVRGGVGYG